MFQFSRIDLGSTPVKEGFGLKKKMRRARDRWLEHRLQTQLNAGRDRLKEIARGVPVGKNGAAKVLKARVKTLQGWHGQASAVLPLVKTFLKLT